MPFFLMKVFPWRPKPPPRILSDGRVLLTRHSIRLNTLPTSSCDLSAYSPTAICNIPDNRGHCKQNLRFLRMKSIMPDSHVFWGPLLQLSPAGPCYFQFSSSREIASTHDLHVFIAGLVAICAGLLLSKVNGTLISPVDFLGMSVSITESAAFIVKCPQRIPPAFSIPAAKQYPSA